jgi:hypothetical protein
MSSPAEKVLGVVQVDSKVGLGFERLRLLVTSSRIIFARVGKRGTGNAAATPFLGKLGAGFEDLFKGGKESKSRKELERSTPEEVLASDPNNFAVSYGEVIVAEVEETLGPTKLVFLTDKDKLEFSTTVKVDNLLGWLEPNLTGKLKTRRLASSKKN